MIKRLPVLRALVQICGPHFARDAGPADTVGGRQATFVAAPATANAVAETLRLAADRGLAVLPRGAGTKIDWGAPPPGVDLLLDTGRLAGIWHHRPDELTAEVGAGTPVRAVQAALALKGQRLAIDPPSAGATLGGVLAVDEAGPLRHTFGLPTAQVVEAEVVDDVASADGPGGPEPQSGVLVSATMRLQTVPDTRLWVTRSVWTPLQVHDLVAELLAGSPAPAAVEVDLPAGGVREQPPGTLAVLLEGGPVSTRQAAAQLVRQLGDDASVGHAPPVWWGRYAFTPDDVAVRITVPIADLHAAVYAMRDAAGIAVPVRGSPGVGTVHAVLPGTLSPARVDEILDAVRGVLMGRGGRCVVFAAPPAIRDGVEMASRNDLF